MMSPRVGAAQSQSSSYFSGSSGNGGGSSNSSEGKQLRIADARPKLNANANALAGKGFENVVYLNGEATLTFLDVENIHVMRSSLLRLKQGLVHTSWGWTDGHGNTITYNNTGADAGYAAATGMGMMSSMGSLGIGGYFNVNANASIAQEDEDDDQIPAPSIAGSNDNSHTNASSNGTGIVLVNEPKKMDTEIMSSSSWKVHLSLLLKGSIGLCEALILGHPVMVHCSDGWDRTSQLSSLTQVLLDPYVHVYIYIYVCVCVGVSLSLCLCLFVSVSMSVPRTNP